MSRRNGDRQHRRVRLTTAVGTRLIAAIPFFEEELRLVPSLVPPGGTCVDVGAAHGIYTVAMAAAVGPTGRVLSFEPQLLPHRFASALRGALGLRDVVELRRIALGDRTAEDVLVVPYRGRLPVTGRAFVGAGAQETRPGHPRVAGPRPRGHRPGGHRPGGHRPGQHRPGAARAASSASREPLASPESLGPAQSPGLRDSGDGAWDDGFTSSRRIPVRIRSLDELAPALSLERLDLIKIDVEGAELRTLAGAERTLAAFRPALIVEIEARHTARFGHAADAVFHWLGTRGYRAVAYDGHRLRGIDGVVDGVRNYVFVDSGATSA